MKDNRSISRDNRRGISLVVVLGSLVFLSALVLAFLVQMTTELKSSKLYADGASARLLSQSATNIVLAEIKDATVGADASGNPIAWASQPGMIRTYDHTGKPAQCFKLYSDSVMTQNSFDAEAAVTSLAGWTDKTALYTDLNQPVSVRNVPTYPILDPQAVGSVPGFSLDSIPDVTSGANPASMPVKWLYVLGNGIVIPPDDDSSKTATFEDSSIKPDKDNPIIGRIAFWTDDETCKVNINTAAEGTYWDTPRTCASYDGNNLATKQPANHEYQRYPGHPAMTSLSAVFSALNAEQIYSIIPRIMGGTGSSLEGTVNGTSTLTPDSDRLYASADELIFNQSRGLNNPTEITKPALEKAKFFITAASRAPDVNLFNQPRVGIWPVNVNSSPSARTAFDQLIAFCGTLKGLPYFFQRSNPSNPTVDLPCNGSANGLERNRMVLEYLRNLTSKSIPGFGGNFAAKYDAPNGMSPAGTDRDQILTEIFDYIRSTNTIDQTAGVTGYTEFATPVGSGQVVPILDTTNNTRGFGRFPTVQGVSMLVAGVGESDPNPTPAPVPPLTKQIRCQMALFVHFFDPSLGYPYNWPNFRFKITGLNSLQWKGVDNASNTVSTPSSVFPVSAEGAINGVSGVYSPKTNWISAVIMFGSRATGGSMSAFEPAAKKTSYKFLSNQITLKHPEPVAGSPLNPAPTFPFLGGTITVTILPPASEGDTPLQSIQLYLPSGDFPVPNLAPTNIDNQGYNFRNFVNTKGRLDSTGTAKQAGWITTKDVVRSIVPATGDLRMVMPRQTITYSATDPLYPTFYKPHSKYNPPAGSPPEKWAHNLRSSANEPYYKATGGRLLPLRYSTYTGASPQQWSTGAGDGSGMNVTFPNDSSVVPDGPLSDAGVALGKTTPFTSYSSGDLYGDWDNGVSFHPDGPYINKADEGDIQSSTGSAYFGWGMVQVGASRFSPNRMMPSAGAFGSLPTGVWANRPWQTMLFRPDPTGRHPGNKDRKGDGTPSSGQPADHLLLDLFNMPVVEPYAISEPLSTAGKINLNYRIAPFNYINRDTGIRAVLTSEKVIVIPDSYVGSYKRLYNPSNTPGPASGSVGSGFRWNVDIDKTLRGFQQRFASNDIFRSASEICTLPIVPKDPNATYENMTDPDPATNYWSDKRLTGDNSRERPYTTIYPRLTTKSNTFTIHVRTQSLRKARGTKVNEWVEGRDQITGEYRGSQMIERFIDPNNPDIPDYANGSAPEPISKYYNIRLVSTKQFAP